jgi:hypothetical protein
MLMFQPLNAKVEAPNYDFSLEALADFFPGRPVAALEAKNGKPEVMSTSGGLRTLKYFVAHVRYKFAVIVQEKEGTIEDFFARLPSYFLHDIFLQSLVKKHGKQTTYKKIGEEAFYTWDLNGEKHVYSAACTITCFPIFYAVQRSGASESVLEKMKKANRP